MDIHRTYEKAWDVDGDGDQMEMIDHNPVYGTMFPMYIPENSEIYILDLQTRSTKRITNNSSIDVSGSYSPDGKQIVFNSDRSGRRHLYIIGSN